MNTKLIIVDGHCSTGKSSISKSITKQISLERDAYWLHEECENHPIRHDEFTFGALDTAGGMEANRIGMLQKWEVFRDSIRVSGKVCITEGCLLHAYDRYFIHSCWDDRQIQDYYVQVLEVLDELDPIIVFLHKPDLRTSLEKAFIARGKWWRDLMLRRDDRHVYFKDHVYVDENSMFEAIEFEQSQMMHFFDRLQCVKIKVDTSKEQWDKYVQAIVSLFGADFRTIAPYQCDPLPYLGTYRWQKGTENDDWIIGYDQANNCLYTTLFWPYMPMGCMAEDVFELISFPVEMHFQKDHGRMQFVVRGNYEWEYNDQLFIKL